MRIRTNSSPGPWSFIVEVTSKLAPQRPFVTYWLNRVALTHFVLLRRRYFCHDSHFLTGLHLVRHCCWEAFHPGYVFV
jgi:hypothetical protein